MGSREYKSDVFSMLMEDRNNALTLYNALNGTTYDDPEMVEICTLERGISLSVSNDASFVLDMNLSVYEHQSTVCPNMPVRSLIYFTNMLERRVKKKNIYGRKLVPIPTPRFAVFYNGEAEQPEKYELRLSDAYAHAVSKPELELVCTVYNINKGRNEELLFKCPFLKEYMIFVDYVRMFHKQFDYNDLEHAIELAIDRCIEENVLRTFLMENRSEVVEVTKLDYTFDRQLMMEREDSRAEGLEEGRAEGRAEGETRKLVALVVRKMKKGKSVVEMADDLEEDEAVLERIYQVAIPFAPDYDVDAICNAMMQLG